MSTLGPITHPKLRDYQEDAIQAVREDWAAGVRNVAVVSPVGSGKTSIFSSLVRRVAENGKRSVVIAHREELIQQAVQRLGQFGVEAGIVAASRDEHDAQVVVASVQTLVRPGRAERLGFRDVLVYDEAHHIVSATAMDVCGRINPRYLAGFSATLIRADGSPLSQMFHKISYTQQIRPLISSGALVDVRAYQVHVELDLDGIKRTKGDFADGALGSALLESDATVETLKVWKEHASDRSTIVFTPTIETAHAFAKAFRDAGVEAIGISGKTPKDERARIYQDFSDGKIQVVCNAMLWTEGTDVPRASCVVMARPTQSQGLFVQSVGRGLRPFPGKTDCVVLDVVGNTARGMRLATLADLTGFPQRDGESALEAEQRMEEEGEKARLERGPLMGRYLVTAHEVDIFDTGCGGRGLVHWKESERGIRYVSTRDGLWFVWPDGDGGYRAAVRRHRDRDADGVPWKVPSGWISRPGPLEQAVAAVEIHATAEDPYLAKQSSSWFGSAGRARPTDAQLKYASTLGIDVPDDATKAQLSELIDATKNGRWLDMQVVRMEERMR